MVYFENRVSNPENHSTWSMIHNEKVRFQRKPFSYTVIGVACFMTFLFGAPRLAPLIWEPLLNLIGPFHAGYTILPVVHSLSILIGNIIYEGIYILDLRCLDQYKINPQPWPWKNDKKNWKALSKRCIKSLLINHLICSPLLMVVIAASRYVTDYGLRLRTDVESLPSVIEFISQFFFCLLAEDMFAYWTHRLLHSRPLYWIHKQHHEFEITVGFAAEYAHPIEFMFSNTLTTVSGGLILNNRMHAYTFYVWLFWRLMDTTELHSGYELPWSMFRVLPFATPTSHHDYHHSHNIGTFGSYFCFWDTIWGTNGHYYEHLSKTEEQSESITTTTTKRKTE